MQTNTSMKKITIIFIALLSFFCVSCNSNYDASTATAADYPRIFGEFPGFDTGNNRPGSLNLTLDPIATKNVYIFQVQFVPALFAEGTWYVGKKLTGAIQGDADFVGLTVAANEVFKGAEYKMDYSTWTTGVYPLELVVSTKTETTYRKCYVVISAPI